MVVHQCQANGSIKSQGNYGPYPHGCWRTRSLCHYTVVGCLKLDVPARKADDLGGLGCVSGLYGLFKGGSISENHSIGSVTTI